MVRPRRCGECGQCPVSVRERQEAHGGRPLCLAALPGSFVFSSFLFLAFGKWSFGWGPGGRNNCASVKLHQGRVRGRGRQAREGARGTCPVPVTQARPPLLSWPLSCTPCFLCCFLERTFGVRARALAGLRIFSAVPRAESERGGLVGLRRVGTGWEVFPSHLGRESVLFPGDWREPWRKRRRWDS